MTGQIYIITSDSLLAAGIKHLLEEYCAASPIIGNCINSDVAGPSASFIVDASSFSKNIDFFIPRRQRCIIVTDASDCDARSIGRFAPVSDIIDTLSQFYSETSLPDTSNSELSQREIDVLRLVANGHINKEIADILNISINTVLSHRRNISSKLGIRSVSGLSLYALMNGYIDSIDNL